MIDLGPFERALDRAVTHINLETGAQRLPMASTDIKRFSDQFRQVKQLVQKRLDASVAQLTDAHDNFQKAADNADAFTSAVKSYAAELNSLASEMGTNGGPPLDDTFSPSTPTAPAAAAPVAGADKTPAQKLIDAQAAIGREHPSNQH